MEAVAGAGSAAELIPLLEVALDHGDPSGAAFTASLCPDGRGVLALVHYGSRLSPGVAAPDSERDFYLVVESLFRYHGRVGPAVLGAVLPPSVYHARVAGDGGGESCKLCVITAAQLRRETSPAASDLHHIGRFSKRMRLLYARDEAARRLVVEAQARSLELCATPALALLGARFELDEFVKTLLGLSYLAEPRVVEPAKIEALFRSERAHYRAVGAALLRGRPCAREGTGYRQSPPTERAHASANALIRASRRRELLRWPKYLLTFDGWLEYALRKIERHSGRPVHLSERARRHPLVYGWPALYALTRDGLVR